MHSFVEFNTQEKFFAPRTASVIVTANYSSDSNSDRLTQLHDQLTLRQKRFYSGRLLPFALKHLCKISKHWIWGVSQWLSTRLHCEQGSMFNVQMSIILHIEYKERSVTDYLLHLQHSTMLTIDCILFLFGCFISDYVLSCSSLPLFTLLSLWTSSLSNFTQTSLCMCTLYSIVHAHCCLWVVKVIFFICNKIWSHYWILGPVFRVKLVVSVGFPKLLIASFPGCLSVITHSVSCLVGSVLPLVMMVEVLT